MADLGEFFGNDGFDPSKVQGNSVLPEGEYRAVITASSVEESKATPGAKYIKFELTILKPEQFNSRKLWKNVNIGHPKDNVKAIAERELKQICESVGLVRITRTDELHGKPFSIRVIVKQNDSGDMQNEIKKFSRIAQAAATVTGEQLPVVPVGANEKFF